MTADLRCAKAFPHEPHTWDTLSFLPKHCPGIPEPLKVGDRVRVARVRLHDTHSNCLGRTAVVSSTYEDDRARAIFDDDPARPGYAHYGPVSDFERIDPEPTPEPTVAVPVSLIEDLSEAVSRRGWHAMAEVTSAIDALAHPKPAPRRLRVVDLDAGRRHDYPDGHRWSFLGLEAAPDVMAIVEQTEGKAAADRIRAALEAATDKEPTA